MRLFKRDDSAAPEIPDCRVFQVELDKLRIREKPHTKEGDAIAAGRRHLPMIEVDGSIPIPGMDGTVTLVDAFEGRRMLIAYYFMRHQGKPAAKQCEGFTRVTLPVRELSYIHSRDATFAAFRESPYEESAR